MIYFCFDLYIRKFLKLKRLIIKNKKIVKFLNKNKFHLDYFLDFYDLLIPQGL